MVDKSIALKKREWYIAALGIAADIGARMTLNDLEWAFFSDPPALGGGGTGTDPEEVRDIVATTLGVIPGHPLSIIVDDALDTVKIGTTATVNSTDAQLRDRTTHTGVQAASTISDLTESVQDIIGAFMASGTGATVTYNDAANTITITATGTSDLEAIRDAIGIALVGVGVISVTVNDGADTITISSTATANSTDVALRDRSTHTGTQIATTISDFNSAAVAANAASPAAFLNATGLDYPIKINPSTGVWPNSGARTVPSGFTGAVRWDSKLWPDATQPAGMINGDSWEEYLS